MAIMIATGHIGTILTLSFMITLRIRLVFKQNRRKIKTTTKLKATTKKWFEHHFSTGCYTGDDYLQFERDCCSDLKKMAKENGLELHTFNKNHYCFSAVLTNGEKFVYVSISDVRYFGWNQNTSILIRSMAHAKDWTGGPNHQCKWSDVGSAAAEIIERGF